MEAMMRAENEIQAKKVRFYGPVRDLCKAVTDLSKRRGKTTQKTLRRRHKIASKRWTNSTERRCKKRWKRALGRTENWTRHQCPR